MRRSVLIVLALSASVGIAVPAAATGSAHPAVVAKASKKKQRCDPNYRGRCLKPNVSDYDCAGGSGNGPYYVRGPVRVVGQDHYRLDADHDGVGCER